MRNPGKAPIFEYLDLPAVPRYAAALARQAYDPLLACSPVLAAPFTNKLEHRTTSTGLMCKTSIVSFVAAELLCDSMMRFHYD
jgi:hypothetical protein